MKNIVKKILIVIFLILLVFLSSFYIKEKLFNNTNNIDIYGNGNGNGNGNSNSNISLNLTEALVTKVIDGDTIWIDINGSKYKVRFIGINCPEYTTKIEEYGKEATEFTTTNLLGKTIYLQKDVSDVDNYDRLLRYVWTKKITEITEENINNYLFNAILVKNGLAKSNYYKPDILLQSYLERIEKQAKNEKVGMWQ